MGWVPRHALKPGSGPETPTRLPAPSPPSPASEVKGAQGSPGVLRLVSCAGSEDDLVSALEIPPVCGPHQDTWGLRPGAPGPRRTCGEGPGGVPGGRRFVLR